MLAADNCKCNCPKTWQFLKFTTIMSSLDSDSSQELLEAAASPKKSAHTQVHLIRESNYNMTKGTSVNTQKYLSSY